MVSEFISKKKIGEILLSKGFITQQNLEDALELQRENRKRVGEIWVEAGIISEEILARALATQYSVPFIDVSAFTPKDELLTLLPDEMIAQHQIIPYKLTTDTLTIIAHDPTDIIVFQNIARFTGYKVNFVIAQKSLLEKIVHKVSSSDEELLENVDIDDVLQEVSLEISTDDDEAEGMDGISLDNLRKESNDSAIIQLVNRIILQAIQERCTDIHIESTPKDVLTRFRIDGSCYDKMRFDKKAYNAVLSRIKIMCDVDITERTIPQDGGFKVKLKGKEHRFPCIYSPFNLWTERGYPNPGCIRSRTEAF